MKGWRKGLRRLKEGSEGERQGKARKKEKGGWKEKGELQENIERSRERKCD
jgi:hypothetical protein